MLFAFETDEIKVTIEAFFGADGSLIVEGYDIGKTVEEYWGDSDYEYSITILPDEVNKIYAVLKIQPDDQAQLLSYLKQHYNTNTCYSEIRNWLDLNGVQHVGFSWR